MKCRNDIVKYIAAGKSMKAIEVDVTPYGVVMPAEGLYAGIEWLKSANSEGKELGAEDNAGWYGTSIEYNADLDESRTFYRDRLNKSGWAATKRGNASFWLKVLEN